jgi:hypothetical protein
MHVFAPRPHCTVGSIGSGATTCKVQAVMYFRRALKLNHNYLSAWTLMGHEYVEMKNTPAAIGAPALLHCRHVSITHAAIGNNNHCQVESSDHIVKWPICCLRGIPAGSGHQPTGLQGLVRPGPDIRATAHALLCAVLLPQVGCYSPRFSGAEFSCPKLANGRPIPGSCCAASAHQVLPGPMLQPLCVMGRRCAL